MTNDFLLWPKSNSTPYACVLGNITGFNGLYAAWGGKPVADTFPADAEFPMDPEFPENTVLAETLVNSQYLIVASEQLKKFFEENQVFPVEYLKVGIRDHKGKICATYWIINPLDNIDCLDRDGSGALVSRVDKTQVVKVKRTILRDDALDPERRFFRITGYPQGIVIRRDLAEIIQRAGFQGLKFRELDQKKSD